jgi:hypothetical protein
LVLLMGGICECAVEMALCCIICIPSFTKIGTGVRAKLRFSLRNFRGCNIGINDWRDL